MTTPPVTHNLVPPTAAGAGEAALPLPGFDGQAPMKAERIREFDVVTVPDFAGAQAHAFEIRTLFFLASYIASGNHLSAVRLHLACVGAPPDSVRHLAAQAGALITVHPPRVMGEIRCANKFRGFEVARQTGHLLLIDTDVLFMGRLDELTLPPSALAVVPAFKGRVKLKIWEEAYRAAGLPMPKERMLSQARELGCADIGDEKGPLRSPADRFMAPYYNAGVIFTPWSVPLAEVWGRHLGIVNPHLARIKGVPQSLLRSDQTALATALREMHGKGLPLARLPDAFHAHRIHLYRRKLTFGDIRLLHFTGSFSSRRGHEDPRIWARLSARHMVGQMIGEYVSSDLRRQPMRGFARCLAPAWGDVRSIARLLDRLYVEKVGPALERKD